MPFTFAHSAAILPFTRFLRKYVSVTGLIAGSIAPDMEYFIRFSDTMQYSHYWPGLLYFDLPVALVCCFLFHQLIRNPLIDNLPLPVQRRVIGCRSFNWSKYFSENWAVVVVSILIGAALHLLWDQLVHWSSDQLLNTEYLKNKSIMYKDTVVYYCIWGSNSVIGMIVLWVAFWKLPAAPVSNRRAEKSKYWISVISLMITVIIIRLLMDMQLNVIDIVDSIIGSFFTALIVTSVVFSMSGKVLKVGRRVDAD